MVYNIQKVITKHIRGFMKLKPETGIHLITAGRYRAESHCAMTWKPPRRPLSAFVL